MRLRIKYGNLRHSFEIFLKTFSAAWSVFMIIGAISYITNAIFMESLL